MPEQGSFNHIDRDDGSERERVFHVAEINRAVRLSLEHGWPDIWVEGELSDVTRATSGHYYFTLNDEQEPAQIRAVMFRSDAQRCKADLEDGSRVRLRGSLSLFEPRGSFQLIARQARPAGLGDLHRQFERVRKLLGAEGLLAAERKRRLPFFPRVIGVVTSASGAALHDIIRVSGDRCPVRIVVSPCLVQGAEAPASIVAALNSIQRLPRVDLVIVGRGGGSAEDLFAFNDERVARAIAACRVPTISAVGHEVDITIADLVADVRAATPSNAAEIAVPDRDALASELSSRQRALERGMEMAIQRFRLLLDRQARRLRDPREALAGVRTRLHALQTRLGRAIGRRLSRQRERAQALALGLSRADPRLRVARDRARLAGLLSRLRSAAGNLLAGPRARLAETQARVQALSPLAVLGRGYAIAIHQRTGKALLRASDADSGDTIFIRLHEGRLVTRVQ
jgi:exodeoxyribonuclease VII large subunit